MIGIRLNWFPSWLLDLVMPNSDEKRVISANWVKDDDINRFLRYDSFIWRISVAPAQETLLRIAPISATLVSTRLRQLVKHMSNNKYIPNGGANNRNGTMLSKNKKLDQIISTWLSSDARSSTYYQDDLSDLIQWTLNYFTLAPVWKKCWRHQSNVEAVRNLLLALYCGYLYSVWSWAPISDKEEEEDSVSYWCVLYQASDDQVISIV